MIPVIPIHIGQCYFIYFFMGLCGGKTSAKRDISLQSSSDILSKLDSSIEAPKIQNCYVLPSP